MNMKTEYLNAKEAANMLKVSMFTFQRWTKNGHIPYMNVGSKIFFRRSDLIAFLNQYNLNSSGV